MPYCGPSRSSAPPRKHTIDTAPAQRTASSFTSPNISDFSTDHPTGSIRLSSPIPSPPPKRRRTSTAATDQPSLGSRINLPKSDSLEIFIEGSVMTEHSMRKKINPQQEPKSILRSPGTMSSTPRRRVKFEGLSSPEDEALLDSAINDLASGTSSTANLVTEDNHRASIPAGSEGMPPAGEPSSDPVRSLDSILATVGCLLKVEIADRLRASKEMIVEQMRVIEELKNEVMCLAAKAEADKEEMERLKRFEARVLDAVKETGRI